MTRPISAERYNCKAVIVRAAVVIASRKEGVRRRVESDRREHRAHADRPHQCRRGGEADEVDKARPRSRRGRRDAREDECGREARSRPHLKEKETGEHRADQADRVGFEHVRRHARAIAHVVADIVGDGGRVARIIFVELALDLADEVGSHVCSFRVNATAETGKHADQAGSERESDEARDCLLQAEELLSQEK